MAHTIQPLILMGASTCLSEIAELVRDINRAQECCKIIGALDDNSDLHGQIMEGIPVLGDLDMAHQYQDAQFVLGIGSYRTRIMRYEILKRLQIPDERFATLIHPHAKVYPTARVGPGCIIHAGAIVGNDAVLESFVTIAFNSAVGTFNRIGRCALIASLVVSTNKAQIGSCAFIGAGSCIAEGVRIGPGAMVGIGSVVFRDVKPGLFVLGNPARSLYRVKVPQEVLGNWEKPLTEVVEE